MHISEDDHSTLARALVLEREHGAGIFPRNAGQHRHFGNLIARKLLVFEDYGTDIDGVVEREVKICRLTPLGRALAMVLEGESEPTAEVIAADRARIRRELLAATASGLEEGHIRALLDRIIPEER